MGSAGFTYALYSFYQSISDASFNWLTVMSGAIMGVGAASLWTSQGAIITTYPREYAARRWIGFVIYGQKRVQYSQLFLLTPAPRSRA
jgi:hypothetical protein